MELYRLTGMLTGLVLSGGISLFFYICRVASEVPGTLDLTLIYMLMPGMILGGFLFDTRRIWKNMMRLSPMLAPSYLSAGIFWSAVWPFCMLSSSLLVQVKSVVCGGQFVTPYYLTSFGMNGVFGFFLYQAVVGSGMGMMFFMAYRSMFGFVSFLRDRLGMGEQKYDHPLTNEEIRSEFGFRR